MEDRTWVHSFQLTNDNSPGSSGTTFYSNNLWVLTWFETVQKPGCPVTFHEHYILLKASSTLNHPLNYGDRTVLDVKGVPVNAFPVAEYGRCGSISRICSPGTDFTDIRKAKAHEPLPCCFLWCVGICCLGIPILCGLCCWESREECLAGYLPCCCSDPQAQNTPLTIDWKDCTTSFEFQINDVN